MKKLILFFCVTAFCNSCIPWDGADNHWHWVVINNTEQILKLKYPTYKYSVYDGEPNYELFYQTEVILPNNIVRIGSENSGRKAKRFFNYYFDKIVNLYGRDVSWQIFSEDENTVLKTWSYSPKDMPDQRFFKESSWAFEQNSGDGDGPEHIWTFEISLSDISN